MTAEIFKAQTGQAEGVFFWVRVISAGCGMQLGRERGTFNLSWTLPSVAKRQAPKDLDQRLANYDPQNKSSPVLVFAQPCANDGVYNFQPLEGNIKKKGKSLSEGCGLLLKKEKEKKRKKGKIS